MHVSDFRNVVYNLNRVNNHITGHKLLENYLLTENQWVLISVW